MNWLRSTLRLLGRRSFDDLLAVYEEVLSTRVLAPKTLSQRRSDLRHLRRAFGGRSLAGIEPHHVAALIKELVVADKLCTARLVLSAAHDVFNEALLRGWIDSNPAQPVRKPKAYIKRQRLTLEQWHAILDAGQAMHPPWFVPMMLLALTSAQRRSDLVRMRFDHVREGCLFVEQFKTGARIALPLALRLDALDVTLGEVIESCRRYGSPGPFLLRSPYGSWQRALGVQSLSNRFALARNAAGIFVDEGTPPSLHEVRSLAERLYRTQGIDTQTLLGHRHQSMTDTYNNDRGLSRGQWRILQLPQR